MDVGRGCEEHWKQWSPEWMTAPSKSAYDLPLDQEAFSLSLTTHHLTSSGGPPECLSSLVGFFYPWRPGGLDLGCPQPESDSCHPPTSYSCLSSTNQRRATTHLFTSQAEKGGQGYKGFLRNDAPKSSHSKPSYFKNIQIAHNWPGFTSPSGWDESHGHPRFSVLNFAGLVFQRRYHV